MLPKVDGINTDVEIGVKYEVIEGDKKGAKGICTYRHEGSFGKVWGDIFFPDTETTKRYRARVLKPIHDQIGS